MKEFLLTLLIIFASVGLPVVIYLLIELIAYIATIHKAKRAAKKFIKMYNNQMIRAGYGRMSKIDEIKTYEMFYNMLR